VFVEPAVKEAVVTNPNTEASSGCCNPAAPQSDNGAGKEAGDCNCDGGSDKGQGGW
jgi:hypothetical protein